MPETLAIMTNHEQYQRVMIDHASTSGQSDILHRVYAVMRRTRKCWPAHDHTSAQDGACHAPYQATSRGIA
jgi:hypothetical protein